MELHAKFVDQMKFLSMSSIATEYSTIRSQTSKEHLGLTTGSGGLEENVKKNRYKDILPYDQTRVVLLPLTSASDSDYINANFIQGATETKTYIATQGPLTTTLVDFWRMIWQNQVKKKKCEPYWATHQETSEFGPFLVSNMSESSPNDQVVVRSLVVQFLNEKRTVSQFQYTAWPDHDIPYTADGILEMMDMARNAQADSTSPVLVHCSAGCGRTGVICALDYIHDLLVTKRIREDFSIMKIVVDMRRQRPSSVQTQKQYQFVYSAVAEMFERSLQSPATSSYSLPQSSGPVSGNVEKVTRCQPSRTAPSPASRTAPSRTAPSPASRTAPSRTAPSPASRTAPSPASRTAPSRTAPSPASRTAPSPASRPLPLNRSTCLQPVQSVDHSPGQKMNDTYAVVNKTRQTSQSKPSILAPSSEHDYEETAGACGAQAAPIYSTVRPRSRALHPTPSATPIYDTVLDNARLPPVSHLSGYELVAARADRSSTDDDYEFVSKPVSENSSSYCSPTSLGFNCRVKKPKGPRDPPAEWALLER